MTEGPRELLRFSEASRVFTGRDGRVVHAVEGLTFSVGQGEFVCVVGPSGCGKSTLLRLAAGLDFPTSGQVLFSGEMVRGPERRRGIVFQSYNAFPWLTVRENIAFGLASEEELSKREKVDRWLGQAGLTEFEDSYPKSLSGGMRQRLALARTLIVEPDLLLLDEPFGALDEPVRRSMQGTLLRIVGELRCTVLFVTHDIREAMFLGDRVMLMSNRPGSILETFDVPVAKPRSPQFEATAEFSRLHESILQRFPASLADE